MKITLIIGLLLLVGILGWGYYKGTQWEQDKHDYRICMRLLADEQRCHNIIYE